MNGGHDRGDDLAGDAGAVRSAIAAAQAGLVDRELIAEVTVLCAVAGEHLLVVGAPGTAKSEAVRRIAAALGGRYFEYLLGRFTEPNELFGPVDLRRLREGVVEIETSGMLPEAEVAFLDEVFLGSTAILNTLLGVLNERVFRRGSLCEGDEPGGRRVDRRVPPETVLFADGSAFATRHGGEVTVVELGGGAPRTAHVGFPTGNPVGLRLHAGTIHLWDRRGRVVCVDPDRAADAVCLRTSV